MKFGVSLLRARPRDFLPITQHAESLGFESVWLSEHLVFTEDMNIDYPGAKNAHDGRRIIPTEAPSPFMPVFDATGCLSFLAGSTTTIRLGTYVYLLGIRHPLIAARVVQTLDYFSDGRLELGIGAGWLPGEFRAVGHEYRTRGALLDESIVACKKLWTERLTEHHGRFYDFESVGFEPKPVQRPHPRIHVGGESKPALRRVAEHGDGWIAMEHTPTSLEPVLQELRNVLSDHGRTLDEIEVTVATAPTGRQDVQDFAGLGVDRLVVTPWTDINDTIGGLDGFADRFLESTAEVLT